MKVLFFSKEYKDFEAAAGNDHGDMHFEQIFVKLEKRINALIRVVGINIEFSALRYYGPENLDRRSRLLCAPAGIGPSAGLLNGVGTP